MSELNFQDVGRNDKCPCGSGKKYKKCHMRIQQVQQEVQKQTRTPEQILGPDTDPWSMFCILGLLHGENQLALYRDILHTEGPQGIKWADENTFLQAFAEGNITLAGRGDYTFLRFRVDAPYTYILIGKDIDDPSVDHVTYQLITLYPNELGADGQVKEDAPQGPRIWDIAQHKRAKSSLPVDGDVHLRDLGITWQPRELTDAPTRQR